MKPRLVYLNSNGLELHTPMPSQIEALTRRNFIRRASGILIPAAILAGLALPRRAQAASTIINRTISAASQNAISMVNSTWARPVVLPSNWNQIRLGIRFHMTDTGASLTGNPIFAAGFCSGTSNQYGDATTTHWCGWVIDQATWAWTSNNGPTGGPTYLIGGDPNLYGRVRIGTTNTTSLTMAGGNNGTILAAAATSSADRMIMLFDLIKGSPNYTFQGTIFPNTNLNGIPTDVSATNFLALMQILSPSMPSIGYHAGTNRTLAVSESTNGTLNAVNLYWNRADATFEITDVAVSVLS